MGPGCRILSPRGARARPPSASRRDPADAYDALRRAAVAVLVGLTVLFVFLQRYFIKGLTLTGLKG